MGSGEEQWHPSSHPSLPLSAHPSPTLRPFLSHPLPPLSPSFTLCPSFATGSPAYRAGDSDVVGVPSVEDLGHLIYNQGAFGGAGLGVVFNDSAPAGVVGYTLVVNHTAWRLRGSLLGDPYSTASMQVGIDAAIMAVQGVGEEGGGSGANIEATVSPFENAADGDPEFDTEMFTQKAVAAAAATGAGVAGQSREMVMIFEGIFTAALLVIGVSISMMILVQFITGEKRDRLLMYDERETERRERTMCRPSHDPHCTRTRTHVPWSVCSAIICV